MSTAMASATLADRLWPATAGGSRTLRLVALAVFGSALLWASAKVQIPFWPVPMTLQSGVVLLLGVAYGWRLAAATVLLYLAEGAIGLPVFAGTPARGIGLAYMVGPTGGYLVGFLAAAVIAGATAERTRDTLALAIGLIAAMVAIHVSGTAWLATFIGLDKALTNGLFPFVPGDVVKTALVLALTLAIPRITLPRG